MCLSKKCRGTLTWDLGDVDEVDDGEVLDLLSNGEERLVHVHARRVPVVAKPDHHQLVLFTQNGLKGEERCRHVFSEIFLIYFHRAGLVHIYIK